jgi:hypothetical protein
LYNKVLGIIESSSSECSTNAYNNEYAWRKINIFNSMVTMDDKVPDITESSYSEDSTNAYNNE